MKWTMHPLFPFSPNTSNQLWYTPSFSARLLPADAEQGRRLVNNVKQNSCNRIRRNYAYPAIRLSAIPRCISPLAQLLRHHIRQHIPTPNLYIYSAQERAKLYLFYVQCSLFLVPCSFIFSPFSEGFFTFLTLKNTISCAMQLCQSFFDFICILSSLRFLSARSAHHSCFLRFPFWAANRNFRAVRFFSCVV